jgi:hypothetical protein
MDEFAAIVAQDDEGKEQAMAEGRTKKKSTAAISCRWASRKVRQVGEGRGDRCHMCFAIVSPARW